MVPANLQYMGDGKGSPSLSIGPSSVPPNGTLSGRDDELPARVVGEVGHRLRWGGVCGGVAGVEPTDHGTADSKGSSEARW